ncbi:hypothetical protein HPB49_020705 [Dermacentor silvarum]|uniref:Uncharacterized protein n=1 Tax=Dermacentor silvarum TaxID=543639 RepID=A0ACB8CZL5_DERSI|nr:hypothetical protein HPB49_020705 [Dermacentor silvarum]
MSHPKRQSSPKHTALIPGAAIIRAVASGAEKTQVAKNFGIAPSPLPTILSSKEVTTDAVARGVKGTRKKLRSPDFEAVEEALFKWFLKARVAKLPVSGALLQRKARDSAEKAILHWRTMQQRSITDFFAPST